MQSRGTAGGPFERHIVDAIELNRSRAGFYAAMSGGASLAVTKRLVRTERLLLPLARWMDRRAAPYHAAGIPLLEALFEPMHLAPAPGTTSPMQKDARPRKSIAGARRELQRSYRGGGFVAALAMIDRQLAELTFDPAVNCMERHLLESARRVAQLAPVHAALAVSRGLPSSLWMSVLLFRLHLYGLASAASLDALALPLQRRGVPILSSDLPHIPARAPAAYR